VELGERKGVIQREANDSTGGVNQRLSGGEKGYNAAGQPWFRAKEFWNSRSAVEYDFSHRSKKTNPTKGKERAMLNLARGRGAGGKGRENAHSRHGGFSRGLRKKNRSATWE